MNIAFLLLLLHFFAIKKLQIYTLQLRDKHILLPSQFVCPI